MSRLTQLAVAIGLPLALLCGCSRSGPDLAPVSGTVRIGSKPLPYATITFVPKGRVGAGPSSGVTDRDGAYTLGYTRDRRGAFVGAHDVMIRPLEAPDATTRAALSQSGIDVASLPSVAKKYLDPGTLSAEVKGGKNAIDFQLDEK